MKKFLLLAICLIVGGVAKGQYLIPDSYYVSKAKAQLKAEEASKVWEVAVIGTKNGVLSYIIQGGQREDFELPKEDRPQVYIPTGNFVPYRIVEKPQAPKRDLPKGLFAAVLQQMLDDHWELANSFGCPDGEVYVLVRKVKKAGK